jgi:opacity protein-like surface antigen
MKRMIAGLALVATLGLAAPDARAGIVYLGLQGGVSRQKASLSGLSFDADSSFLYGARAGVKVLSLAIELEYFQAAHNLFTSGIAVPAWNDRHVDYNHLGVNVRWTILPLPVVHPYLVAGYGSYTADVKDIGKDSNGGFNIGAGVELMLGKSVSLLAEGRYHHVKLNVDAETLKLGNFTLAGGLNFYF